MMETFMTADERLWLALGECLVVCRERNGKLFADVLTKSRQHWRVTSAGLVVDKWQQVSALLSLHSVLTQTTTDDTTTTCPW